MLTTKELIEKFTEILGKDKVLSSPSELQPYKRNTLGLDENYYDEYISGVLKPVTAEQVETLVKLANRYIVPLYPISTGRNWGYGSKAPTARGSFIVELSNMNKIREINNETGYVVIEPGVTQEDLTIFLKENCPDFIMDKTGTPAATSVLGNVLERGFGLRACRDKLVNGFEVVSGSGKTFKTGSWGAVGKPFYRYTPGPLSDQLFCQSNFGIITAMSFKLYPRPEQFNVLYCTIAREKLFITLKEIQNVKRHDSDTFCKIFLDRKYITSEDAPFFIMFFMYGKKDLLKLRTNHLMNVFEKLGELTLRENITSVPQDSSAEELVSAFLHPDSTREADVSNYMFRDFEEFSMPNHENLDEVNDFGLCFYDCIIPSEMDAVKNLLSYLTSIIDKKYKLSRRTTLHAYDHETFVVVNYIVFNRTDKDAVKRSRQCVDELYANEDLLTIRLTPWHMQRHYEGREFLDGIKNTFDPKRIISPGRYT